MKNKAVGSKKIKIKQEVDGPDVSQKRKVENKDSSSDSESDSSSSFDSDTGKKNDAMSKPQAIKKERSSEGSSSDSSSSSSSSEDDKKVPKRNPQQPQPTTSDSKKNGPKQSAGTNISNHKSKSSSSDSEESNDSSPPSNTKPTTSKADAGTVFTSDPIEAYASLNPHLKKSNVWTALDLSEEEICLVQIPKSLDPHKLVGKSLSKLKIDKTKYIVTSKSAQQSLLVLSKNPYLNRIQHVNTLTVQRSVKIKDTSELEAHDKTKVHLPDNLKVRHPLFGPEYKKKIVLDKVIEEKLNDTIDSILSSNKKNKKSKKEKKSKAIKQEIEADDGNELIFQLLQSADVGSSKKPKKVKKNKTIDFDDDSVSVSQQILQEPNSSSKKKKKKHKKSGDDYNDSTLVPEPQVIKSTGTSGLKKKSASSIINSTVIPDLQLPLFDLDLSQIAKGRDDGEVPLKKKKQKKIKDKSEVMIPEILPLKAIKRELDDQSSQPPKKKVKKLNKKKQEEADKKESDNLIFDILNSVKNQLDSSSGHKKKKKHKTVD